MAICAGALPLTLAGFVVVAQGSGGSRPTAATPTATASQSPTSRQRREWVRASGICYTPLSCICKVRDCRKDDEKFRDQAGANPPAALRVVLGSPPVDRKGRTYGWAAHHIIAAGSKNAMARVAQAWAYQCSVRPSTLSNGIYLRDRARRSDTRGFRDLFPRDAQRAYHRTIHTKVYYTSVAKRLSRAAPDSGDCPDSLRRRFLAQLASIKRDLSLNRFRFRK